MTKRQLSTAALNILFVLLFLAPARYLPVLLVLFPLAGWKQTGRLSLLYLILLPMALVSQLIGDRVDLVELVRVIEIVVFLLCAGRFQVQGRLSPIAYFCIIGVLLTFSFADLFKISELTNLKQHIWPVADAKDWDYGGVANIAFFRLGSIYYNPSLLAQAVTLLMACVFLTGRYALTMVMMPLIGGLVLLSGSRSAMAIYLAQTMAFVFLPGRGEQATGRTLRKVMVLVGLAAIVVLTAVATGLDFSMARGIDFRSLLSHGESAETKLLGSARYYRELVQYESPKTLWFVAFGQGRLNLAKYTLDSELGYVLFAFGAFGGFIIAVRLFQLMRAAWRRSVGSVNLVWLWSIGASMLFSGRFVLVGLLIYSMLPPPESAPATRETR